jgi:hypothetical protein
MEQVHQGARTWVNPSAVFGPKIIHVTQEQIYLFDVDEKQCEALAERLRAGELQSVATPDTKQLSFLTLSEVNTNQHDTDIEFKWSNDDDVSVTFADAEARDDAFAFVRAALHDQWQEHRDSHSKARGMSPGLLGASFSLMITTLMCSAASSIQAGEEAVISGRNRGVKRAFVWVADFIGPVGVGVIGAALVALFLFLAYRGFQTPPEMRVLTRDAYKPEPIWKTGLMYGFVVLFAFISVRAIIG